MILHAFGVQVLRFGASAPELEGFGTSGSGNGTVDLGSLLLYYDPRPDITSINELCFS